MKSSLPFVVLACFSFLLSGCESIYSPTMNLPHEPLAKDCGQMTGALSGLPQVGTDKMGITFSGEGQIAYGFSNRLALHGKLWSQVSEVWQGRFNGGLSLGAEYVLNERTANIPYALIPNISMLIFDNTLHAYGVSAQLAAWLPEWGPMRPYVAAGPGLLSSKFSDDNWGYGVLMNAGVSITLFRDFRGNVELFGAVERYLQNAKADAYVAPTFSLSWAFDNK